MKASLIRNREEFVRAQQGKKTPDPISVYFFENLGPPIPIDPISLSHKNNIWVNRCAIAGTSYHALFTSGLSNLVDVEMYFVVPSGPQMWPIRRFNQPPYIEESFPIDFLGVIVQSIERRNSSVSIEEGIVFPKDKSNLSKLCWDRRDGLVDGLVLVEHHWGKSQAETSFSPDHQIKLLALVPYGTSDKTALKIRAGRATGGVELLRALSWERTSLPFNPSIAPQKMLEDAFAARDPLQIEKAVLAGADIQRPLIRSHSSFGFYKARPILIEAMDLQSESLIRFLVESGAQVPTEAIACLGRWGSRSLVKLLIEHGADLNATSCDMTALMRAQAFKNAAFAATLRDMGAQSWV